ncbi:hypothetical protein C2E23DRAFT_310222 [Lenzites betulinus]|nr:hypothetical protein C2E23DRAFT_310222 [Lenzites betulinus]
MKQMAYLYINLAHPCECMAISLVLVDSQASTWKCASSAVRMSPSETSSSRQQLFPPGPRPPCDEA